ncbi:MAG: hypothetical protein GPOALKHO_000931 [Sodalis sp.]|nr:MAG: hypothetical protein GPOALKHO_000931 [Sodalis sp.]
MFDLAPRAYLFSFQCRCTSESAGQFILTSLPVIFTMPTTVIAAHPALHNDHITE